MNRRELLQKSFLSLAILAGVSAASIFNAAANVVIKALPGKLNYKEVSPFPQKRCENCKSFKAESGECILIAMKNVMKADVVLVEPQGHCSMWAKIS